KYFFISKLSFIIIYIEYYFQFSYYLLFSLHSFTFKNTIYIFL
ncbi:hypothetical protein KM1_301910, partial [Entamoeba histolytica HM-3:IMSS]